MPAKYTKRRKILVSFDDEQLRLLDKHVSKVKRKRAKQGENYDRSIFLQEAAESALSPGESICRKCGLREQRGEKPEEEF